MKKLSIIFISFLFWVSSVHASLDINSRNAILYNLNDNKIIYEKNAYEVVPIASITKIMTAIIAIENVNIDDKVTVMEEAFSGLNGYAQAGFKVGDNVTYKDLLYGIMLPSGAEAANVLAISIAGSNEQFVKLMNDKIEQLGLSNTHFDNPIGIDSDDNYSTAYDISIILKYALTNSIFKEIYMANSYITSNGLKFLRTVDKYASKDHLDTSLIKGAKTGYTPDAGYCLSSITTLNNVDYLFVTLGADDSSDYINDAINIYTYYSENYDYLPILTNGQLLVEIPIKNGKKKSINIYSDSEIKMYLEKNMDLNKITYEYDGIDIIDKKIKINDKLGMINIKYNNEILSTIDVYLKEEIKYKPNLFIPIISIIIILILFLIIIIKLKKRKQNHLIHRKN